MPEASQVPPIFSPSAYNNKLLFTEHYLEQRIQTLPVWNDPEIYETAKQKLTELQEKRTAIQPQNLKEAQLEKQWIHWILNDVLDHHFAVQVTVDYGDSKYGIPDMVFTRKNEQAAAIGNLKHNPETLTGAIAVGDAKAWGINFEKASGGNQSPVQQIDKYLRYSELPWGILTDGRYWRLYERNSSKFNKFYEIDLDALLDKGDTGDFLYFYLFFRQKAFSTGWLDKILKGSQDYAESLRDSLEDEVFSALEHIAQGFLDYRRNDIKKPLSAETLREIYEESLVLLYRLLFIFYAESRDILPMNNENYRGRSLMAITNLAKTKERFPANVGADDSDLYSKLEDLFFMIDAGDSSINVPAYNGKLFSDISHPFLKAKKVGDIHLLQAINRLATIEVKQGRNKEKVSVDYQDLDVSHLGTIYEKLLEYQLDIATENLVTGGKNQTYKKASAKQTPTKKAGEVYLRTGNNERKVTGSYYTPEYIVRFIVEKTLEPLLLEITEQYATQSEEDGNWIVREPEALRDAILDINVLDPATGSGHFAVDVVVYIAEWLNELGLELPEIADEPEPLSYWMRQVASACIYAVDINPLAVELAKLSIWLKTLARDKPLSFLDHHIRVGNSLVGTSLAEIEDLAPTQPKKRTRSKKVSDKQAPLFDESAFTLNVQSAVGTMTQIERVLANDVSDVKRQELMYAELRAKLQPYEQLATVWTARHFGLEMNQGEWETLYKLSLENALTPRLKKLVEEAESIAAQPDMRFFHWDVAFPEVFFDENGERLENAGFDAVVGNPPYVRQESIKQYKPYLETNYDDVYSGIADLYIYFYKQGLELLKDNRRLSYITPNKWFSANYGERLRKYLAEEAHVEQIVDFGHAPIFKDVDTFPMIGILKPHITSKNNLVTHMCDFPREELKERLKKNEIVSIDDYVQTQSHPIPYTRFSSTAWSLEPVAVEKLMEKIKQTGEPLANFVDANPYRGILTGLNKAFLVDNDTRKKLIEDNPDCEAIIRPYLRGRDIKRWQPQWENLWMIVLKSSENQDWAWSSKENAEDIFKSTFPSIYNHFLPYREQLIKRQDQGKYWWELRSCTYYDTFEQPKLLHTDITWRPQFAYTNEPYYIVNTAYMWSNPDLYVIAVLNSPLMWSYMWRNATHGKDEALRIIYSFIETVPIAPPASEIRDKIEIRVKRLMEMTQKYTEAMTDILDWLSIEFGIESVGQKIEEFSSIDEGTFLREVKKRTDASLTASNIRLLKDHHAEYHPILSQNVYEQEKLEQEISNFVNQAYGVTAEEIELMWKTAPPRMPIKPPGNFK